VLFRSPIIKPKGIDDVPIVTLTFWTPDKARTAFDMQEISRAVEIELKRVKGTRDVTTLGGPGHMIRVLMDSESMNAHGVTAQDIRASLQVSNASQPAGNLVAGGQEILVQSGTYIESAADVKKLVVGVFNRQPVFMSDVARIEDGPDQPSQYVMFAPGKAAHEVGVPEGAKGAVVGQEYPAVTLSISKKPGVNAADVAQQVIARANSLKGTVIPDGVNFTVTRNYGQTATDKAQKLIGKLIFATSFVVLLVLFALGWREAIIVGAAVSLTLFATLFASWAWGFTLNRVSLFALIFSIGILVDDAIVVVENIHRRSELEPGKPLWEIIPGAVDEVGGPTILATMTVIAALLPMAFVSGLMGPYMSPIPINASMGMAISLAIAFVITPWFYLVVKGKQAGHGGGHGGGHGATAPAGKMDRFFRGLLTRYLDEKTGKRARRGLWLGILAAIGLSVSLALIKVVVLKMLPFDNKSEFQVVLDMPVGTPVEGTARVLQEMGAYLSTVEEVTDYESYAGTASPINFNGLVRQYYLRTSSEMGDIQVNLVDKHHRTRKSHEIAGAVRQKIHDIAAKYGGNAKVVEVPPGPPVLSPIVAEVYGPDYAGQMVVAKRVRARFEQTPDIVGIDDSVNAIAPKIVLRVDQAKAALLGVAQDRKSVV
jgi:multidrug efflux pump subunit AcrB